MLYLSAKLRKSSIGVDVKRAPFVKSVSPSGVSSTVVGQIYRTRFIAGSICSTSNAGLTRKELYEVGGASGIYVDV